MKQKRVFRYFRLGDLSGMEYTLNAMSRGGWQFVRGGRLVQVYRQEPGAWVHRLSCSPHRPGSAEEIRYFAAQEREGWALAARRKGWLLFRKPARQAEEGERLAEHRAPVEALFKARIARLESLRRWMLVLAAIPLFVGYVSDLLPVLYSTALPLLVALGATYAIKFMEEGLRR